MQKLAEICVRRPVFATMLILALTVIGAFSFFTLGVDRFPRIDLPIVTVSTVNPGAAPEQIETEITDIIEGTVSTISGIDELRSTSVEGLSQVFVTFVLEKDVDVAAQEVRDKVDLVLSNLPTTIDPPIIQKLDPDSAPVMLYAISAKRETIDVTSIVENEIQEKLQTVSGVGDVLVFGGRRREVHVYVNPDRLRAYNLTVTDVAQALRSQNMELPAGRVDAGAQELTIRALGRVQQAEEFGDIVVKTVNGYPIRIRDIGVAEDSVEEPRGLSRLDGRNAVSLLRAEWQFSSRVNGAPLLSARSGP